MCAAPRALFGNADFLPTFRPEAGRFAGELRPLGVDLLAIASLLYQTSEIVTNKDD